MRNNFVGTASFTMQGSGYTRNNTAHSEFYPSLTHPAQIRIHGGCTLKLTHSISFHSSLASITSLREVDPQNLAVTNAMGVLADSGTFIFDTSNFIASTIYGPDTLTPAPLQYFGPDSATSGYFSATNSLFYDGGFGAAPVSLVDNRHSVNFKGCTFDGTWIDGFYGLHTTGVIPSRPLSVFNCTFDHVPDWGIRLRRSLLRIDDDTTDYNFNIVNNDFRRCVRPRTDGIFLENFISTVPNLDSTWAAIYVTGNTFTTRPYGTADTAHATSAIHLSNTSAVVNENVVSAAGYGNGIVNESAT